MSQMEETIEKLVKRVERLEKENEELRKCVYLLISTDENLSSGEYSVCSTAYANFLVGLYRDFRIPSKNKDSKLTKALCIKSTEDTHWNERNRIELIYGK